MDFFKSVVLVTGLWGARQTTTAQGQMFGNRQVGQPIGRQVGPSQPQPPDNSTGRLQGNERFVRGNRQGNQFVGAAPGSGPHRPSQVPLAVSFDPGPKAS